MKFSPIQQRMLEVLSDGLPHTPLELHACLDDELGPVRNIRAHLTAIRKKLLTKGQTIVGYYHLGKVHYRHVRLLNWKDE